MPRFNRGGREKGERAGVESREKERREKEKVEGMTEERGRKEGMEWRIRMGGIAPPLLGGQTSLANTHADLAYITLQTSLNADNSHSTGFIVTVFPFTLSDVQLSFICVYKQPHWIPFELLT